MVPVGVISLPCSFFRHLTFEPSQKFSERHLPISQMFRPRHTAQTGGPLESAPDRKKGCLDGEWNEELAWWCGGGEVLRLEKTLDGADRWGERDLDDCLNWLPPLKSLLSCLSRWARRCGVRG